MTAHPDELTINDYVDGSLDRPAAADVDRHLAGCGSCRELAADLRAVRDASRALPPLAPPAHLWEAIERATAADGRTRSTWTWRAAALAASVVVAALVGWQVSSRPEPSPATADRLEEPDRLEETVPPVVTAMAAEYDAAFAGLQQIAAADRAVLDEATRGAFDSSLAAVDRAIDESRAAVATEPDNDHAQVSLLESFKMKLALLQDTVALINELRRDAPLASNGTTGS